MPKKQTLGKRLLKLYNDGYTKDMKFDNYADRFTILVMIDDFEKLKPWIGESFDDNFRARPEYWDKKNKMSIAGILAFIEEFCGDARGFYNIRDNLDRVIKMNYKKFINKHKYQ